MKIFLAIIFIVAILSLQVTIFSKLGVFGAAPNLIVAVAVALALIQKEGNFDWLIFALAVCFDLLIGRPFGLTALSVWLTFSATKWLEKFLFKQSGFVSLAVLSLIGASLYQLFLVVFSELAQIFKYGTFNFYLSNFYTVIPAAIVYNTLLCLLVFIILKKVLPAVGSFGRRFNLKPIGQF